MKIKDYKCKCGHNDFFFVHESLHKGIYCSYCGKWLKWADKDEQNLAMKRELKIWRWIPVSEELPKAGEYIGNVPKYYLVQNEYGDMMVARYTHSEYWEQMYQHKPIYDEIVAWMPLPEPYKANPTQAESEVQDADSD